MKVGERVTAEYVEDVPYVRHFIPDLAPARLRLAAAMNGVAPPPASDFDYCELGCAHGDTIAALAAAHPESRFLGVDINGDHIASCKRLAREGGLDNAGFLERDFADLVDDDLGDFDYVVAYGVLSWIGPDKRAALIDFAKKKLRPGGILYVSYNAMPGWAAVEPLRQLLLFPSALGGETTDARARRGLEFARSLEAAGAEYFTRNPSATEMLATMTKAGLPYVVHEYMHEHWAPMYFARVAWELANADLHFAGSLPIAESLREAALPEAIEKRLASVQDRITFESLKDFAVNQFFRRDVFVKGPVTRATPESYLDATVFAALGPPPADTKVSLGHRSIDIGGPVLEALGDGAASLDALVERTGRSIEEVRAGMRLLLLAEHVLPLRAPPRPRVEGPYAIASPYDERMIRRPAGDVPIVLTSRVAGTAFSISALDALALRIFVDVAPAERARWVKDFVGKNVLRLRVGEHVIADRAEQESAILRTIADLAERRAGKLVELGVLSQAERATRA